MTGRPRLLLVGWVNSPHVVAWAKAMAQRGWDVHVAGELAPEWPDSGLDDVVQTRVLEVSGPPGLRARRLARELDRVSAELRPDVVHAHYLTIFGFIAALTRPRPLVMSAWGSDVYRANALLRRRARLALRRADIVLADSADLARATRALAPRSAPIEIVHWGIDLERFAPGDAIQRADDRRALGVAGGPLILSPRGLQRLYNIPLLLESFAIVRDSFPDAELVLKHPNVATPAGIEQQIDDLRLGDSVRVVGHVGEDDLARWYRAADVCVSIPDTDSSPRTVWEALACGRPVVVSDLPWARAELTNMQNALVTSVNATAVAQAIKAALSDDRLTQTLATQGRKLAEDKMDARVHMDRAAAIYAKLRK